MSFPPAAAAESANRQWAPAFAGVTEKSAGVTEKSAGVTGKVRSACQYR